MTIPILMTMDNRYVLPTKTAIYSMRENTDYNIKLKIIVLCAEDLSDDSKKSLYELESKHDNLNITFKAIDDSIFANAIPYGRVALCSYYRLVMDELVTEDKCLFLDGDMIICSDLFELYNIDVGDVYLAAVRDAGFRFDPDWSLSHMDEADFGNMNNYFNAGVMVLNIKKIREDKLKEKFLLEMNKGYSYMDQDILNKVCEGCVRLLSEEYNCFHRYSIDRTCRYKSDKSPKIIHYAGAYKPWDYLRVRYADKWWEVARKALNKDEFYTISQAADYFISNMDFKEFIKRCRKQKVINIVGYSQIGLRLYDVLLKSGILVPIYMCDNSGKKQKINNITDVLSVKDTIKSNKDALWINTSQKHKAEIDMQLIEAGIDKNNIIYYFDRPWDYLEYVDESFMKKEYEEKMLFNGYIELK